MDATLTPSQRDRLIAAAPDMLQALHEAEAGLCFAGADKEPPTGFVPSPTLALRIVRAAIAKASVPVLTDADSAADLAGTPRPDNPSV